MPFGGAIVNRVHDLALVEDGGNGAGGPERPGAVEGRLAEMVGDDLARKVARNFEDYLALARHDRESVERLRGQLGSGERLILVPFLDQDVHDLGGLALVNRHLFADE